MLDLMNTTQSSSLPVLLLATTTTTAPQESFDELSPATSLLHELDESMTEEAGSMPETS